MLSLDDMVVRQKELINKGYQIDNITCAALMLVAERLGEVSEQLKVLTTPTITHEPMPKIGPLPTSEEQLERDTGDGPPLKFADKIGIPPERQEKISKEAESLAQEIADGDD